MPKIQTITCRKVLDSRGDWTIETTVNLNDGSSGKAYVPQGASTGSKEAISIPVDKAISIVNDVLNDALEGENPYDQEALDRVMIAMDGTKNKSHLGGNSILSVSLALARASAQSKHMELYEYLADLFWREEKFNLKFPTPLFNVLNGGKHASNNLSFQEFMVIPSPSLGYDKALNIGVNTIHQLGKDLEGGGFDVDVGDEGGFAPNGLNPDTALSLVKKAVSGVCTLGKEAFMGLDVAASSFFAGGKYKIKEEALVFDSIDFASYFEGLLRKYPLIYIEDPMHEDDFAGWKIFMERYGSRVMVTGDDLVVTSSECLERAEREGLMNSVIVKPNQVGSLTETFEFVKYAKNKGLKVVVSHRSGDTGDDFIADLALAVNADFIKAGAPVRGERVAKYNRLLDIYSASTR